MSAHCTNCTWTGTVLQVIDGTCPECRERVRYDNKTLAGPVRLASVAEFNRRVLPFLEQYDPKSEFLVNMIALIKRGYPLTPPQQNGLYSLVMRIEGSITDRPVYDFAVLHARGY